MQNVKKNNPLVFVQEDRRKRGNNKRRISNESQRIKKTRLTVGQFNWQSNCFHCETECISDQKNPNRKD